MIVLGAAQQAQVTEHLLEPVVDARLEMRSLLGAAVLGRFTPTAGVIRWDGSRRCGKLDVDLRHDSRQLHQRHPLAPLGQVLEAWWTWPAIGVSVPCGRWLIAEAEPITPGLWRVSADPEGPARLDRARWWSPGTTIVSGALGVQVSRMVREAGVQWVPAVSFRDTSVASTECPAGQSVMESLLRVVGVAGREVRADRMSPAVVVGPPQRAESGQAWSWRSGEGGVLSVSGSPMHREVPNRVMVWCERTDGDVTAVSSESAALRSGPRRWGGPYGVVTEVVKIDEPVPSGEMLAQAKRLLTRRSEDAASVAVTMRADPRVEVGDIAHVIDPDDGTDCRARITSVQLDAGTGIAAVECSGLQGRISGNPIDPVTF